jgi:hypothetical protein
MLLRPWLGYLKSVFPRRHGARARALRPGRPRLSLETLEGRCLPSADVVLQWNQVLLDTIKADRVLPVFFSREAAIVHAAMYDAVNAIDRSYTSFFAHVQASHGASLEAAAAQAAHDTMSALFPTHQATFDATLAGDLAGIPPGRARQGVAVGQAVAQQILAWRSTDGSGRDVPYTPGSDPGDWRPTPPAFAKAVAPQWGQVTPFAIPSDAAFRPPAPPALTSAEYAAAYNEVKSVGAASSTTRTAEQSEIARFWYGTAGTFTSAGYWNQIAQQIAEQRGDSLVQNARLFALLNLAQADAYISVWGAKYASNFWRPVTAITDPRSGQINPDTPTDPSWAPFLPTPAFPSYTSGHSGHSGAAAAVLAAFFGSDAIPFTFSSDSLPGVTRSFPSFSAAARECSDSRVYAGIHWRFDVTVGQAVGDEVGNYVVTHFLLPAAAGEDDGGDDGGGAPGLVGPAATAFAVAPPFRVGSGVVSVYAPPAVPPGTVNPASPAAQLTAWSAEATGLPPLGAASASPGAGAAPVSQHTPQRPGAGSVSDGLPDDLALGAVPRPAWWLGAD